MTFTPAFLGVLGAVTVLAFVLALWVPAYTRRRIVERRVAAIPGGGLAMDRAGLRPSATSATSVRSDALGWLSQAIARSHLDVTPGEVIAAAGLVAAASAGIAYLLVADVIVAVAAGIAAAMLPFIWIAWERRRRRQRFVKQLPDTVQLLASLVRGGSTFLQALEHVGRESEEPTRSIFAVVVREIGLGASPQIALDRLAERYPSEDLTLLVAAVNVHQQIGGSLSTILERIAETLRERVRLHGEVRTLTASQRASAAVLAALPIIVGIARAMVDPESFALFFSVDYLRLAIVVAALMATLGAFIMGRIASIDV